MALFSPISHAYVTCIVLSGISINIIVFSVVVPKVVVDSASSIWMDSHAKQASTIVICRGTGTALPMGDHIQLTR